MVTPEQLAELEATHKRVAHVKSTRVGANGGPEWEVVIKKPSRAQYKGWRQKLHGDGAADATEQLVRALALVPPAGEPFDALLEEWPGLAEACAPALRALCGLDAEKDLK